MAYEEVFRFLVDLGLIDVILPFILVFTLIYGVLQKTQLFGAEKEKNTKFNALIAFVIGFLAILATNVLNIINIFVAYFMLLLIIFLMLALVLGLAGAEIGNKNKALGGIIAGLAILFLIRGFADAGVIDFGRFMNIIALPALGIILIAILWYFGRGWQKTTPPTPTPPPPSGGVRPPSGRGHRPPSGGVAPI